MNAFFGLLNLGGGEIILILALVLILFGAKKLPELARGMGQGIKEFKKATREVTEEIQNSTNEAPYSAPRNVIEAKRASETPPATEPSAAAPQFGEKKA